MSNQPLPPSEIILRQTEEGRPRNNRCGVHPTKRVMNAERWTGFPI